LGIEKGDLWLTEFRFDDGRANKRGEMAKDMGDGDRDRDLERDFAISLRKHESIHHHLPGTNQRSAYCTVRWR